MFALAGDYGIDINPGVYILVIGADLSLKAGGKGCTRF
jgi:hypothetical protein